jgi:cation transport ATPase
LDFDSRSDLQIEEVYDAEYKESDYPSRQKAKREREERGYKPRFMDRKKKKVDDEGETGVYSSSRSSKKIKKVKMSWVKLVFKIFVIGAVCYNFHYLLNFMKVPVSNFYHTLFVVGICASINFIAVWILFYKSSFMRFYLSLFAIVGSFGYYFYVNYTNHSFLGNNAITSLFVIISVLMAINPKENYYVKSFVFLLIPIIGIYLSGNKFALVWTLMVNAGLILIFRVAKSKSNKKEARARRSQKQSA